MCGTHLDKKMTIKEELDEVYEIMEYLAHKYFNGECAVTKRKFERKNFVIHHEEEHDNDILSRPYRKQYGKLRYRIHYLRDLKKQFDTDSTLVTRTVLILNYVHRRLDHPRNGICKFPMDQRERFCEIALKTKTQGRKRRI